MLLTALLQAWEVLPLAALLCCAMPRGSHNAAGAPTAPTIGIETHLLRVKAIFPKWLPLLP